MIKKISACILLSLLTTLSFGQVENESSIRELLKVPIPPSPNAAALGKFGDIQVGLSTGIPSISIPLFQWSDNLKELLVDVSLNYHAGGHKVEDMPSNCGLGWALNAGGVVSRTVRGVPDDGYGGYLNTPPLKYLFTTSNDHLTDAQGSSSLGIHYNNSTYYDTVRAITERMIDGEFDIFNISAGNISAKFFIDKNGGINFFTQTNLSLSYEKESYSPYPIKKFTLLDERAITYIFDVLEISEAANPEALPGSQSMANVSGFYLSKIISADKKDTIYFSYTSSGNLLYEGGFSESLRITLRSGNSTFMTPVTTESYSLITTTNAVRLSLIKLPDSTQVSFAYNLAREDYYGDHALTSVTISNGEVSRKFDLSYDYFPTSETPSGWTVYSDNDYSKRLKLTQVQQISGTDSLPPYIFQYNVQNLPPRNSKAQDHWGYYNGKANTIMVSKIPRMPIPGEPVLDGGDRNPVEQYAKASVLEKIIYPAGGYTKFTYHINDSHTPLYNIATVSDSLSLDENDVGDYTSLPFTGRNNDSVQFTVKLFNNLPPPENEPWSDDCPVTIMIKSTDNAVKDTIYSHYSLVPTEILVLPTNKTYEVKYETECGWLDDFSISIYFVYSITPTNKNVGGLRVEKVEDNDSIGNKIITEYEYLRTDSTSSGEIQHIPNFSFYKATTYQSTNNGYLDDFYDFHWNVIATPTQTLSYFKGSPIIYKRVKVKKSSPTGNIGYSVHEFTGFEWSGVPDGGYPFIQKQDLDWEQGLSLKDSVFNSSNQLVKSTENEWEHFVFGPDSAKTRNMITGLIYHDYDETPTWYVYGARSYIMSFGRSQLKKATETLYANGDSIKTIAESSYDPDKYLVTKQRTSNSKGDSVETRFYYPFNYNFETDDAMSTVIAKETWKKKSSTWYLTGAIMSEYDEFNSSFIKQKKIIAAEISEPLTEGTVGAFDPDDLTRHSSFKDQVEYLKYDNSGRYTEIKSRNKPTNSFIWSVNRNYPIAHVLNAAEADIAFTSFETLDKGNWIFSGSITTHPTSPTGRKGYSLAGGNITKSGLTSGSAYIITYWKRDSSSTVTVNSGNGTSLATRNGWILYTHEITGTTSVTVSGTAYIDELRLYPKGGMMTTYTYQSLIGMTSQCDVVNRIAYYEYDGFGRLKLLKDQDRNVLKVFEYKYKQSQNQ